MAREIEIKARISNPGEIRKKIFNKAVYIGTFEKEDSYWQTDGDNISSNYGIRIRREDFYYTNGNSKKTVYVTWKTKEIRNGMEFNDEREFEVSSASVFEEFLAHLGYRKKISKKKKGSAYSWKNITAEVAEVEGLGWFIELEIILTNRDEKLETSAHDSLICALDELGIEKEAVESRSYTQMLAQLSAQLHAQLRTQ